MPRLSNFQKSKNETLNILKSMRRILDYRTYNAYESKINSAVRKDNVVRINAEILKFKDYSGNNGEKFTTKKIKDINKAFDALKVDFSKENFNFNLEDMRSKGLTTKQILLNILRMNSEADSRFLLNVNGTRYTLNAISRGRLLQYAENDFANYEEGMESDAIIVASASNNPSVSFSRVANASTQAINQGSFFKYYCSDFDLTEFGIYPNKWELFQEVDKVCLVKALREGGLSDEKYSLIKTLVKDSLIPFCKLKELCDTLQIQIRVKRERKGKDANRDVFGKEYEEKYHIGLLDGHYFIIRDTEFRYLLEDCYKKDLSQILGIGKNEKVNSYQMIKWLLSDKKYLQEIPYQDLENTAFYKMVDDDIKCLEYDKKCCKLIENTEKEEISYTNVFFDFETNTKLDDFHMPYLCCVRWKVDDVVRKKSFIGRDCGKQMLRYLDKAVEGNIQLIAHNATYDYQFLVKYLDNFSEIKRGSRMLSAKGKYFKKNIKIKCSYHLISSALNKFGKMFQLEQEKEVMPYSLYNEIDFEENPMVSIEKVITGKDKYGHLYLKEKDVKAFLNNIKKWGLNKEGYYDIIEYSRIYCEMDCEVLMNGYNTFRDWILQLNYLNDDGSDTGISLGLDINNLITSATLAHKYMVLNGCYEDVYLLGGVPQQFIQKCVVGGRTMSNSNKQYNVNNGKKIADFDGVSLYASSMKRLKGFLKGLPSIIENCSYNHIQTYDGYFVEVEIKNVPIQRQFPLMSYKNKSGIRDFTNDMVGKTIYVDKIMLEDMIEFQGLKPDVDFQVLRGYYFNDGFNTKVNRTIDYLFETRKLKKQQGNPIQEIYKLIMNSAYGKSIMKEQTSETRYFHKQKEYEVYLDRNYERIISVIDIFDSNIKKVETISSIHSHQNIAQVGVSVLSMSKRIMNEVMCLAEDNHMMMFYQDTDSIHMYQEDIPRLEKLFMDKYNRELIGEELGQFHSDFEIKYDDGNKKCKDVYSSHLIVLGKKCYIDRLVGIDEDGNERVAYHIRLKGVPNSTIEYEIKHQEYENAIELYEELYEGEKINFDLTEGMGKCRFQIQKNFGVKTLKKFDRIISFKKKL
jgi:hypothetical protein